MVPPLVLGHEDRSLYLEEDVVRWVEPIREGLTLLTQVVVGTVAGGREGGREGGRGGEAGQRKGGGWEGGRSKAMCIKALRRHDLPALVPHPNDILLAVVAFDLKMGRGSGQALHAVEMRRVHSCCEEVHNTI